jgi:hypothetical protein
VQPLFDWYSNGILHVGNFDVLYQQQLVQAFKRAPACIGALAEILKM